jgi:hypothetical protein
MEAFVAYKTAQDSRDFRLLRPHSCRVSTSDLYVIVQLFLNFFGRRSLSSETMLVI